MDRYYKPGAQIKSYSIIKLLGQGRYGIVYLAQNDYFGKCIIKQLKKDMLKVTRDKLFYEQELLRSLNYPSFPKFIETFRDRGTEYYVMEYMAGRVFEDLVVRDDHQFTRVEIYDVCTKLLQLIEILQLANIVHRDIRLPNVIQRQNKELVLIDFGLARSIDYIKYFPEMDYWYLGDFLIHLYYTTYQVSSNAKNLPWYKELNLTKIEKHFLKKLLGIDGVYHSTAEIRFDLERIKAIV